MKKRLQKTCRISKTINATQNLTTDSESAQNFKWIKKKEHQNPTILSSLKGCESPGVHG